MANSISPKSDEDREYIEVKRRQALFSNEPELREFDRKLRNIIISKEQQCQTEEKRYEELRKSIEKRHESEILAHVSKLKEETESRKCERIAENKTKYGQILEFQMELKKRIETTKKSDIVEENEKFVELEKQYKAEEKRRSEHKMEEAARHRSEIDLFVKSKEAERQKLNALSLEEERKAEEYRQYQQQRNEQLMHNFKAKMRGREEICEKIGLNIFKQQKLTEERDQLIKELREYENAVKHDEKSQNDKRIRFKGELIRILKAQIEIHDQKEKSLKEEEILYREQILHRVKEEERREIENRFISKLKNKKHSIDVLNQIQSNEQRNIERMKLVESTNEYITKYNEAMRQQIEEEKVAIAKHYLNQ